MRALTPWSVLLVAALVATSTFSPAAFAETKAQEETIPTRLYLNKAIERKLAGGARHLYQVVVAEGQYVHLQVEQRGIDVVLIFRGPDGAELLKIDSPNGLTGYESLDFVAAHDGRYQLIITALDKAAKTGDYRVRLTELRKAKENDAIKIAQQQTIITASEKENLAIELMAKAQLAEAEQLLQEAARLRRSVPGEPYLSRPLNLLASAYENHGKADLALRTYEEALPYLEKDTGKGSANVGYALYLIGRFYLAQNNLAQAEPKLRSGVEILDTAAEAPLSARIVAHQTLAHLYKEQKQFSKAETEKLRAIELAEKESGSSESIDSVYLRNELGELYIEHKDIDRGFEAFKKALAICDKIKVDRELAEKVLLNLMSATNLQGLIAREQNSLDRAEEKGRSALDLLRRLENENKDYETEFLKSRVLFNNNLGETLLRRNDDERKDLDAAEKLLREAFDIGEKLLSDNDLSASVMTNLGSLLYKRRYNFQARSFLQKAIDRHRSINSSPEKFFEPVYLLGQVELDQHSFARAAEHLLEARGIAQQKAAVVAEIDSHLGELYTATGDFGRADSSLRQAMEFYEKQPGHFFELSEVWIRFGKMYEAKGSFNQAESCFLRAVRIVRNELPGGKALTSAHLALLHSLGDLAFFYINRGNYEQAEQVISEVRAIIQSPEAPKLGLGMVLGNFGAAYGLRGQLARAEKLLREALSLVKPESREAALVLGSLGSFHGRTLHHR